MPVDVIDLARKLIQQPSVTPDDGRCVSVVREILEPLGFTCHELIFDDGEHGKVHNLYARIGSGSPNFCFAGHTDVVAPGDETGWTYPPYAAHVENGMLYGRGAEDMKGAIAAFIAASASYLSRNKLSKGSISLLLTGDEEGTGVNGTPKMLEWLREQSEALDVCLVGEPTNPMEIGEMVKIGRRGSMITELTVKGKQGHVAYPALADNPVTRLVKILDELKSFPLDNGTTWFPPSNLEVTTVDVGNTSVNVIPEKAFARFNIRFNDQHVSENLKEWIDRVCRKHAESFILKHRVSGEAFLTPPGALSNLLVESAREVTGRGPKLSTTGGTSDARIIRNYCPVVEFGATGRTPHMVDECVKIADLETLEKIYETVLRRYFA